MRKTALLLLATAGALSAFAQSQDERKAPEPVENLWFATDEIIYVPQYTFTFSTRALSGTKAVFKGGGTISSSSVNIGPEKGFNQNRYYQDGSVLADTRTDNVGVPNNSADGMTNHWNYVNSSQEVMPGYIAFHTYSAEVTDQTERTKKMGNALGLEARVSRDFGRVFRNLTWSLTGGLSLNDIRSSLRSQVQANINTTTDLYTLNGAAAPGAGYSAPSSTSVSVMGPDGQVVYTDPPTNSVAQTKTVDTTTLIGSEPLSRSPATAVSSTTQVTNSWKVKGAYFTFRGGPTIQIPISRIFRGTLSLGPAIAMVGTTYTIDQELQLDSGTPITNVVSDTKSKILLGFYVDAAIEMWVSERTGFYAGAVYQNNGSYDQTVKTDAANYSTRVDLSRLSGFQAGINYRF